MRSIRGALARPSMRSTTRLPLTSASVGTVLTRKRSASSGSWSTSTAVTRRRVRSLRARCAIRLSIRRAGPEWAAPKKTRCGRLSLAIGTLFSPANASLKLEPERASTLSRGMWEWYRIGLSLGLGIGLGAPLAALIAPRRALVVVVAVLAAGIGAAVGYAIGGWHEAVAGGIGGALGAPVVATIVTGTLRRGGTRGGTALLVGLGALGLMSLAVIPFVGFLEAVAVPGPAARARGRSPGRYAGLRSLARD